MGIRKGIWIAWEEVDRERASIAGRALRSFDAVEDGLIYAGIASKRGLG